MEPLEKKTSKVTVSAKVDWEGAKGTCPESQTLANRGSDSRLVLEAIIKALICACLMKLGKREARIVKADCVNLNFQILKYLATIGS